MTERTLFLNSIYRGKSANYPGFVATSQAILVWENGSLFFQQTQGLEVDGPVIPVTRIGSDPGM